MKYYKVRDNTNSCLIGYLLCGYDIDGVVSLQFTTYADLKEFTRRWSDAPGCVDTWQKDVRKLIEVEI
jgi:hypothetical protein